MGLLSKIRKLCGRKKFYLVQFEYYEGTSRIGVLASTVITLKGLNPSVILFRDMIQESHNYQKIIIKGWKDLTKKEAQNGKVN